MSIAITTPNGHVGSHVLRDLVRAGVRPRVLVRDPASLPAQLHPLVDAVAADQFDARSVVAATEGVEIIHWVSPPSSLDDPLDGYRAATDALLAAVRANGIERVVLQSSAGAERRHGMGDIDGLGLAEQALDDAGVHVVHLRCGYFFTNLLMDLGTIPDGRIATALDLEQRLPWVDPRDVAAVAVGRLLQRDWTGRNVQGVHGPEDLSFSDAARIVGDVIGRAVRAERIDDDALRELLGGYGMTPAQIEAVVGMSAGTRDGGGPAEPRDATTTTPTTLGAWAWSTLRPALAATGDRPAG